MNERLWHLIQTTDSTFPVGGFAHSFGLEGLVQVDLIRSAEDLSGFIERTWIPALAHIDYPLVRMCRQHAHDNECLFRLDQLAWASRATSESRRAQTQMGQQRLKLIAQLSAIGRLNELLEAVQSHRWMANWPSVCGVESACLAQPVEDTLLTYGYQNLNGILAASAKLIRIGPSEIQRILYGASASIQNAILASASISEDEIGWFTPMLDVSGSNHEHAYSRLFIS